MKGIWELSVLLSELLCKPQIILKLKKNRTALAKAFLGLSRAPPLPPSHPGASQGPAYWPTSLKSGK